MTDPSFVHLRAIALGMVAIVTVGCGPDAAASSQPLRTGPLPSPAPIWDGFEVGDAIYDGAFEKPFGAVVSGVAFEDGFVLVGSSRDGEDKPHGTIWTTPDGETWTRVPDPDGSFDDVYFAHVATDGVRLVALGWHSPWFDGRRDPYVAWTSADGGATWERHDDVESTALGRIDADGIVGSPAGAGFLAWGAPPEDRHTQLLWSADGLSWERLDYPGAAENDITTAAPVGAGFVALGGGHWDGTIPPQEPARAWFSPDGRTWQAVNVSEGRTFHGVYPTAGGVYATGRSPYGGVAPDFAWHSADGRSWRVLGDEAGHSPFTASNGTQAARFFWQDDRSISLSSDGIEWRAVLANLPKADWDGGMYFGRTGILLHVARTPIVEGVQHQYSGVLFLRGVRAG